MPRLSPLARIAVCHGVLAIVVGCLAPPPSQPPVQELSTDSLLRLPVATADYSATEWSPGIGRMSLPVRKRHLPPDAELPLLWEDNFDLPGQELPPEWRPAPALRLQAFRSGLLTGTELAAPPTANGELVLERRLTPEEIAGRDVTLAIQVACPSARRLQTLDGIRLSITAASPGNRPAEIFLPINVESTPGWERLAWSLRFGDRLDSASLRLHFLRPGASIIIARMEMLVAADPRQASTPPAEATDPTEHWPATASAPASRPSHSPVNLIAGGDFETGRRSFFASLLRQWADGEPNVALLPFEYENEAVVGERSLRLPIREGLGRVGFGPLNLATAAPRPGPVTWYLKLYARAARTTTATISLRAIDRSLGQATFTFRPEWQAFTHAFRVSAGSPQERSSIGAAELVIDVPCDSPQPLDCWLDAVSLTDEPIDAYVQAERIEVGITGPAPLTSDLANVVPDDEIATFSVDLAANPFGRPALPATAEPPVVGDAEPPIVGAAGSLALDVLDAWDRSIWSRTSEPVLPRRGKYGDKVSLRLPRGYYRLVATLWSGEPGRSRLVSQDSQAVAVISFDDAVPLGNRYGLTAAGQSVSGYTTALGAGWLRMNFAARQVEIKPGVWDLSLWQPGLNAAKQAGVELVAAMTLPGIERFRRTFAEQFLAASPLQPIGVVVDPPPNATRPADDYGRQLEWIAQVLGPISPHGRIVFDISALTSVASATGKADLPGLPNLVVGYSSTASALPEQSEPLLSEIGQRYGDGSRVWDLGVPVRLGGNCIGRECMPHWPPSEIASDVAVTRLDSPGDPALAASRMIRSILIRALSGSQLVCAEAVVLDPLASIHETGRDRLHEADLTPRPALVAFERMTSLLNDATLVRWIDQPDGSRVLYFEKDDGGAVAAMWRPFGLSLTYLSFAGLPSTLDVIDCFGMPEPILMTGNVRVVAVNEFVRYVVATPQQAPLLAEAITASRVRPGPPQSQPAR